MAGQPRTRAKKQQREQLKKLRDEGAIPKRRTKPKKDSARVDPARKADLVYDHTPEKWAKFLEVYIQRARQDVACEASGIPRQTVYKRRQNDEEFERLFAEAKRIAVGRLADEAVRRAVDGVEKPVFYRGEEVGYVTEYSDSLLQFMLINSGDPQYSKSVTQDPAGQGAVPTTPTINLTINNKKD